MATERDRRQRAVARWYPAAVRVACVLAGWWWAWRRLRHTSLFYDEWTMVDRIVHRPPWNGMTRPFNSHLWLFQDPLYRAQANWFGLDDHWLVVVAFLAALAALQIVLAAVLRRAGVPWLPAILAATVLTYLGAASQDFVFAIQVSPTLATAAAVAPAVLVLGRPPQRWRVAGAGGCALVAFLADSAMGTVGLVFAAVLILGEWTARHLATLAPTAALAVWWYGFVESDTEPFASSLSRQISFGARLLVRAAGAWFGAGAVVGAMALAVLAVCAAVAVHRGWLAGPRRSLSLAGVAATAVVVAGISRQRAGLPGFTWRDYNRYLHNAAVPLALAAAPVLVAVVAAVAGDDARRRRVATVVASAVAVAAFAGGVPAERDYGDDFVAWNQATRRGVAAALVVLADGCPAGTVLDPAGTPLGGVGPQVTTSLLAELRARGLLRAPARPPGGAPADPAVVAAMCR